MGDQDADSSLTRDYENRRLICQICCEWSNFDDLYVDSEGVKWDICVDCGEWEAAYVAT